MPDAVQAASPRVGRNKLDEANSRPDAEHVRSAPDGGRNPCWGCPRRAGAEQGGAEEAIDCAACTDVADVASAPSVVVGDDDVVAPSNFFLDMATRWHRQYDHCC